MPRAKTPRSPLRTLLDVLWRQPLYAIPFAIFFGLLYGQGPRSFVLAYQMSLVFAYAIGLALWVAESFVARRLGADEWAPGKGKLWQHVALYAGTAILGSITAALIIHFTILPGFLGSSRSVIVMLMFTGLFVLLFTAIAYAIVFYQHSLQRVRADEELNLARRIQRSFLLSQFPSMPRLEVHAVNVSSKQVSGDFYDVVPAGDRAFLLAIADVAGKGVPAALLSSMLQASLRTQANNVHSVATILRNINALVYRSTSVHQFATFFLARVEESSLELRFSNAGHNHPLLFRAAGGRVPLERGGTVVGILEDADFEEGRVTLEVGDRLILYTDGISEAEREGGEQFGEERLAGLVESLPSALSAQEVTERILGEVRGFLDGTEAGDDMTVMVLRVR
jgi:hypothetical protein